jgi:hypothetical protein
MACYTQTYPVETGASKACLCHAELYTIGDKYGVTRLQSCALQGLHEALVHIVYDVSGDLNWSECMTELFSAITHIYDNTQEEDPIRKMVAKIPWSRSMIWREHLEEWTAFLRDTPGYACDAILLSGYKIDSHEDSWQDFKEYVCEECGGTWNMDVAIRSGATLSCFHCGWVYPEGRWQAKARDCVAGPRTRETDMRDASSL